MKKNIIIFALFLILIFVVGLSLHFRSAKYLEVVSSFPRQNFEFSSWDGPINKLTNYLDIKAVNQFDSFLSKYTMMGNAPFELGLHDLNNSNEYLLNKTKSLPTLKSLYLKNCLINDNSFLALKDLIYLKELYLYNTPISDNVEKRLLFENKALKIIKKLVE